MNDKLMEVFQSTIVKKPFSVKPLTVSQYSRNINNMLEFLNNKDILEITRKDLKWFLLSLDVTDSTYNNYVASFKALWRVLIYVYDDEIENDPSSHLVAIKNVTQEHKVPLTLDEQSAMLKVCNRGTMKGARNYAFLKLMLSTGLRIMELSELTKEDFYNRDSNGKIELRVTKGSKDGSIWLTEDVISSIEDYLSMRDDNEPWLFLSTGKKQIDRSSMSRALKNIARKAGFEEERVLKICNHCLRATTSTNLVNDGTPVEIASKILRHSNVNTTMKHYVVIDESRIRQAMGC